MKVKKYTPDDFADATMALLPEGKAFDWPVGGFGHALLKQLSEAPARLLNDAQDVIDYAIDLHRPQYLSWSLDDYQRVADEAAQGFVETLPRSAFCCGSECGERLWEDVEPENQMPVTLVRVEHLVGPFVCGTKSAGDRLWATPFALLVQYYASVVNPKVIWDALMNFKQAHVVIYMEDITGWGGEIDFS